jgi:hypothetical protein
MPRATLFLSLLLSNFSINKKAVMKEASVKSSSERQKKSSSSSSLAKKKKKRFHEKIVCGVTALKKIYEVN